MSRLATEFFFLPHTSLGSFDSQQRPNSGGDSPKRSCQNLHNCRVFPAELSSRSCRIFHEKVPSGQSRYRIAIMEEAASVARTPATCLEVWSDDHRQTPGGLKKSKEAKAFRKKLTKRPLALRCQILFFLIKAALVITTVAVT